MKRTPNFTSNLKQEGVYKLMSSNPINTKCLLNKGVYGEEFGVVGMLWI